jgi:serine/threonine-protein kinase HipA
VSGSARYIYVGFHQAGAYEPCGIISYDAETRVAGFTYLSDYKGPPLDPINLNYRKAGTRAFAVNRSLNDQMLHRVFMDYMPGKWGMEILQAEYPVLKRMAAAEQLYWFGSRTVGALSFHVKHLADEKVIQGIDQLERVRAQSVEFVARRIEQLGYGKDRMMPLASHGGARAKATFVDQQGEHWLVKFNTHIDAYNFARVEGATQQLARKCGINAVETKVLSISEGNDLLFVKRFDRTSDGRRPHRISMFTLMPEDKVRSQDKGDYSLMFEVLDKVSCDPVQEKLELFRRMLFNIAVNNTDSHLKNFDLLMDAEKGCFELSPSFDNCVDVYANPHVSSVFGSAMPALDDQTIEISARRAGVDAADAFAARNKVVAEVSKWRLHYRNYGVGEADLKKLQRAFDVGLRPAPNQMHALVAKAPKASTVPKPRGP